MARRSGLGRGLGALIPAAIEAEGDDAGASGSSRAVRDVAVPGGVVGGHTFREVPIDAVQTNPFQPRKHFDDASLEPLAASIAELGVLQPLLVREVSSERFELIAGERRLRASKQAGLKVVPVIVREAEDLASLEQALVENLHRKDLNALDEASAYRQLIDDFAMTHDQVGKRMGKSRASVSNLLRLLNLAPKVQRLLIDEKLSEGHARALLGTEDEAFQAQLAERAVREGLSVRAVEEAVRLRVELAKPQLKRRSPSANATSAPTLEWQERLVERLDTKVAISIGAKRGKIVIDFADLEDLDRISQAIAAGDNLEASKETSS